MNDNEWMQDPELAGIEPAKLIFLEKLVVQGSKLSKKEMMPFLLSLSKLSKENNISFEKGEMKTIYHVLQKYAPAEDLGKMSQLASYFLK